MLLIEWMLKEGKDVRKVSEEMGVSYNTVHNLLRQRTVNPRMAVRVEEYTKGEVTRTEALWPKNYVPKMTDKIPKKMRLGTLEQALKR
jgi:lambda repressor-like predicted transcriptional regulator